MKWKTFLSKYGLIFSGAYLVGFIVLVTFYSKFHFPTMPGDILIQNDTFVFYLPLVSSAAIAAFTTVMYEAYKLFNSF